MSSKISLNKDISWKMIHLHLPGLNIIVWYQFFLHVIEVVAGEVVGAPIDVGLGTVLEERPWKNCSTFPEGQLWLNPVTARSLKPLRLSQGGATGELVAGSFTTWCKNWTTPVEDTASPNTSRLPTNAGRTDKKLLYFSSLAIIPNDSQVLQRSRSERNKIRDKATRTQ